MDASAVFDTSADFDELFGHDSHNDAPPIEGSRRISWSGESQLLGPHGSLTEIPLAPNDGQWNHRQYHHNAESSNLNGDDDDDDDDNAASDNGNSGLRGGKEQKTVVDFGGYVIGGTLFSAGSAMWSSATDFFSDLTSEDEDDDDDDLSQESEGSSLQSEGVENRQQLEKLAKEEK